MTQRKRRPVEDPPLPGPLPPPPGQPPFAGRPWDQHAPGHDYADPEALNRHAAAAARAAAALAGAPGPDDVSPSAARRLVALLAERASRRLEGLKLYEALPTQLAFHQSRSRIRLLRGSNRSGKTLAAAVEVARAVTGQDPAGKYPLTDGRCFCVGRDLDHVGEVMWRKLARAGQFRMILDERSRKWRAWRPWNPSDRARREETRGAPPLIPPRLIREVSWENKRAGIPALVRLTNGWELSFYSSLGKPPAGSDLSVVWCDEEIVDSEWLPEMQARIIDRRGCLLWSATPQAGTEQLFELHERAERCRLDPNPDVAEFVVLMADNPFLGEEDRRAFAQGLSDEEALVRVHGEFALLTYKVYPEFNMSRHGVDWFAPPDHWTRYLAVDPGHRVCAVLFAAVPPPSSSAPLGPDSVCLYDELYLKECDARSFAEAVRDKTQGQTIYAMVIDPNMAAYTELGGGKTVGEQYADALTSCGVRCTVSGSSFLPGCDDVAAGILAVKDLLRARPEGPPRLRVLRGALPNFEYEIARYHHKRIKGVVSDAPDQRRDNHLLDALRYLALLGPKWVKPVRARPRPSAGRRAFLAKRKRERARSGGPCVYLGPGKGRA